MVARLIRKVILAVGFIVVILLVRFIIKKLAKCVRAFLRKAKTENDQNIEAFLQNRGSLSPKRYSYSDIKKITNSFRTKLGQGGFGSVFQGKLENGSLVAVKVLKGLKDKGEEFINEVATISRTSHVHIVTLLGFCFEGSHRALIYEFMPNGSLDKFIHDGGSSTCRQLGWEALYQIAIGIARGLEYLHRGRKNICVEVDRTSEIYFPYWIHNRLELDEELGLHGIMDDEANASARRMIIVGLWCIQTDPSHRPSMSRVVEMLEGSSESLPIPPKPVLSAPSRAPVDSPTAPTS
ncbi:hypothetical protein C3L33_22928, partial [Rhododendron williamsianum]